MGVIVLIMPAFFFRKFQPSWPKYAA